VESGTSFVRKALELPNPITGNESLVPGIGFRRSCCCASKAVGQLAGSARSDAIVAVFLMKALRFVIFHRQLNDCKLIKCNLKLFYGNVHVRNKTALPEQGC